MKPSLELAGSGTYLEGLRKAGEIAREIVTLTIDAEQLLEGSQTTIGFRRKNPYLLDHTRWENQILVYTKNGRD